MNRTTGATPTRAVSDRPARHAAREFLTVRELAELLRVKERKVYDLAAAGEVPCSRATGKLLFPEAAVRAWIAGNSSGTGPVLRRPAILLGSHDPLLEWAVRRSHSELATLLDGSLRGLERFTAGEGMAAGLHLRDDQEWNLGTVAARCGGLDAVLVHWAMRRRGLVVRPALAARIDGLEALTGHRLVPRPPESGSELLFRELLDKQGLESGAFVWGDLACSEQDAVQAVAQGRADATFGMEALAVPLGLGFVPLVDECFDLLVDRRAWFDPPMQRLLDFSAGMAFREHAGALPGYDIAAIGSIRWNA